MKTILLMSCALCAGMNGYGMMVDSMRESNKVGLLSKSKTENNETSLLSPKTDQNASSLKRTGGNRQSSVQEGQSKKNCTKTEPEPPQKEFSVELSQAEWEEIRAHRQLRKEMGNEMNGLLESGSELDNNGIGICIKKIIQNHSEQDALAYHCIESYLLDKLGSEKYATIAAAKKILNVLNDMSPDELFQDNCEEE